MGFGPTPGNALKGQRLQTLAVVGVFVITPLLFVGGPDWLPGPLGTSLWNLGHIAFFALLTMALRPWRRLQGWRLWLVTTAGILVAGILIEAIQSQLGREADWHDVLRNLIGVWLVLGWHPVIMARSRHRTPTISLAAVSALLLVFELASTGIVAARQFELSHQLPLLYNFDHGDPEPFWRGHVEAAANPAQDHGRSLRIELNTDLYSGAALENFPGDWRGYDYLKVGLFNPGQQPVPLTLRINDLEHERGDNALSDRYNTGLKLAPGLNTFTLALKDIENAPKNRAMDMTRIHRLTFFSVRLPEPRTVYLLELSLE